jgi:hypothetical protein
MCSCSTAWPVSVTLRSGRAFAALLRPLGEPFVISRDSHHDLPGLAAAHPLRQGAHHLGAMAPVRGVVDERIRHLLILDSPMLHRFAATYASWIARPRRGQGRDVRSSMMGTDGAWGKFRIAEHQHSANPAEPTEQITRLRRRAASTAGYGFAKSAVCDFDLPATFAEGHAQEYVAAPCRITGKKLGALR